MFRKTLAAVAALVLLICALPTAGSAATRSHMPYSAVAYMETEYRCGCRRAGVGTMISRYALVTAGHNLLCPDHNKKADTIDFWFGYTSKSDYHYRYSGKFTYTYYCDFSDGFVSTDDIGYVIFEKDVGQYTGWFGWRYYSDADSLSGQSIRAIGFKNGALKSVNGTLSVRNNKQVTFSNTKDLGAEGGPVYFKDGEYYRLLAVYTSFTDSRLYARRLTETIINDMKEDGARFN